MEESRQTPKLCASWLAFPSGKSEKQPEYAATQSG